MSEKEGDVASLGGWVLVWESPCRPRNWGVSEVTREQEARRGSLLCGASQTGARPLLPEEPPPSLMWERVCGMQSLKSREE